MPPRVAGTTCCQILDREVELAAGAGERVSLRYRIGQLWERELKDLGAPSRPIAKR